MPRLAPTLVLLVSCATKPTDPAAPSGADTPGATAAPAADTGKPYVVDKVCAATSQSGGATLVVTGCACAERLACTAKVSGHAIAIEAQTLGAATCDECIPLEASCELGRLPTEVVLELEVAGLKIGELHSDAAGSLVAGPCFDASKPGPG